MFLLCRIVSKIMSVVVVAWFGLGLLAIPANAAEGEDHSQHQQHMDHKCGGGMDHSKHKEMMNKTGYERSEHRYELPDLTLVNQGGDPVRVRSMLDAEEMVMVNFIFTTCTTICPVMSGIFAQVQKELGPESAGVRMISISIDPEYDTPERLREYGQRYGSGPQWQFLTGDIDNVIAVQKAFDVYRGNKLSHEPTTLLRKSPSDPWVRLDGIASAGQIVAEYRTLADH